MNRPDPALLDRLAVNGQDYAYVALQRILPADRLRALPYSIRLLIENVARCQPEALPAVLARATGGGPACEVPFHPNRLMFHDTTCLPALADFAGMRDAVAELGGDPSRVNPLIPAVLTIDHSVIVEHYDDPDAVQANLDIDFRRNGERYRFIRWAEQSLDNFKVIPPGTGIIHQMNMEALAEVVCAARTQDGQALLHPDDMVATDSHTPMINGIGVLAWGIGGLESQAALLGEPVPIAYPEVVGIRLTGRLAQGVTATDLALTLAELLRAHGVVGKFVEFCGPGLSTLGWAARATVANMAPEYGATVMFFPFDDEAMDFLRLSGRTEAQRERVRAYLLAQGLWRRDGEPEPRFDAVIALDLGAVQRSVAGPHQPHERQALARAGASFVERMGVQAPSPASQGTGGLAGASPTQPGPTEQPAGKPTDEPMDGAVLVAAITSCTNTANPLLMLQAGLLARRARERGLRRKPWVKTSLSPGSRTVGDYLAEAGLLQDLEALGFGLVGYGCMTCIGNSGGLAAAGEAMVDRGLRGVAVLSGNRNFEGRVNPRLPAGYLASPALVVAYAIAGNIRVDLEQDPLGVAADGRPVWLRDLMPADEDVAALAERVLRPELFRQRAATIWAGTPQWRALSAPPSVRYPWDAGSTYLRRPRYLESVAPQAAPLAALRDARALMVFGDNVTTDHISPAGTIPPSSAAGQWLLARGEAREDLNQYSTRRSNHEVMLRGAYTNKAVRNRLVGDQGGAGAWAWDADGREVLPVYDAAATYVARGIPLLVFAGWNYGAGSSRDWAAKAQALLGVRAVVARSFERIHRSNLIGMGVLPLTFTGDDHGDMLALDGSERFDLLGLDDLKVGDNLLTLRIRRAGDAAPRELRVSLRLDAEQEIRYLTHGGVLPYVVRKMAFTEPRA
ncbi:aconitate hydratase 1 [Bordetella genomosp. 8]|uniref:Aconitate hydratase n=1 Tax=Bordetella genomosp. 8 TaxID=1416806 RepID=A0A1W6YQK8_9BORD|nr:aconitate hydratase AcnA [Bordetella genomosp. 8]ARP83380.1 aconitate hydratase 1 [Bordetella genomosp. 8]